MFVDVVAGVAVVFFAVVIEVVVVTVLVLVVVVAGGIREDVIEVIKEPNRERFLLLICGSLLKFLGYMRKAEDE